MAPCHAWRISLTVRDVARRCTGVPGRRPDASVSASRGYGYSSRKLRPSWLKTTTNSRNLLLVSFCLCVVRSRQRELAAGVGQLSQGHRKGAGQGPDRRRAHGAHGAGYPVELSAPMPAPGPDRGAPGRACVQINRICTHNERTRHDSTAAPKERRDCAPPPPKSDRST